MAFVIYGLYKKLGKNHQKKRKKVEVQCHSSAGNWFRDNYCSLPPPEPKYQDFHLKFDYVLRQVSKLGWLQIGYVNKTGFELILLLPPKVLRLWTCGTMPSSSSLH